MKIWALVIREITHRKLNFGLALLSVAVAVGCLIGTLTLMKADELRTDAILAAKQAEVKEAGAALEDAMRKIMKGLGFNVVILPEDQDLNEMNLEGNLSKTMPEAYVDTLAKSQIVTVNHLLPTVMKKVNWPEHDIPIILYGTRGEVPILHADPKKPLLDAVPRGDMIVGNQVAQKLDLSEGDRTKFMGHDFTVVKTHTERGTIDDSTIWINLAEAQELLGMENLIHAIQALECQCVGDRISQIRNEISAILPGTQVIERGPPALARAEARNKAKETAEAALASETANRGKLRAQRESFAALMVPLVLVGCGIWIGFLALNNVRERTSEVGVMRAIGYGAGQILTLFLGKSLIVGLVGSLIGYGAGLLVGNSLGEGGSGAHTLSQVLVPAYFFMALALALALSALGSWIPALIAARRDPAVVLQKD